MDGSWIKGRSIPNIFFTSEGYDFVEDGYFFTNEREGSWAYVIVENLSLEEARTFTLSVVEDFDKPVEITFGSQNEGKIKPQHDWCDILQSANPSCGG